MAFDSSMLEPQKGSELFFSPSGTKSKGTDEKPEIKIQEGGTKLISLSCLFNKTRQFFKGPTQFEINFLR